MSAPSIYNQVFDNNRRWVEQLKGRDASFFAELSKQQSPEFLFIGCADSRVPESQVMGVDPGHVFVHRNVANVVTHTDVNVQSVIEYAVNHLHVKHIVVCGHTHCGGVGAAMKPVSLGVLDGWLREVRDVYLKHKAELEAIEDEDARYRRLVELNVREQCLHVMQSDAVQRHWRDHDEPSVHGWVYDLESGLLEDLELDFSEERAELGAIYGINA